MASRPPGPRTSARWLAGALVAVLAVATLVLVAVAMSRVSGPEAAPQQSPAPSFTFGASASPPATTAAPTPTTAPGPAYPRAEERFLSVGPGAMWRAVAGECGSVAPLMERSTDGGQTWREVTPRYLGIGQVITLDAFAGTEAESVARMGAGCETQALRTFTQGRFWEPYPEVLAASRYLDPATPATVITPDGPLAAPCDDPRSARAAGSTLALVCAGTPFVLGGDRQWVQLPVPDAAALSIAGDRILVAARAAGCDGLAVTALSGAGFADAASLGCAPADPAAPVAVAAFDDGAVVWSGDAVTRLGP